MAFYIYPSYNSQIKSPQIISQNSQIKYNRWAPKVSGFFGCFAIKTQKYFWDSQIKIEALQNWKFCFSKGEAPGLQKIEIFSISSRGTPKGQDTSSTSGPISGRKSRSIGGQSDHRLFWRLPAKSWWVKAGPLNWRVSLWSRAQRFQRFQRYQRLF